ncbi:hypothetical protein BU16DRAFT_522173 [Lophium mytilinum]|uniref:Zn(2)-C6 fungal-type domain-containing protein n=1 Tax=Lophium mytilinum TaxID=390894 RepID=A0A6A6R8W2_9PEZI|nr:hypothetical protein BU16DRAFT_522173 [Lophium mytilinum]
MTDHLPHLSCENCRQKKEKCSGGMPCERCFKEDRLCELGQDSHFATAKVDGNRVRLTKSQRSNCMERVLTRILGVSSVSDDELVAMASHQNLASIALNSGSSGGKQVMMSVEDGSLQKFSMSLENKLSRGSTDEAIVVKEPRTVNTPGSTPKDRSISRQSPSRRSFSIQSSLSVLPSREMADRLVHIFVNYVQCNNFFVQESWLHGKLDLLYSRSFILTSKDIPVIATVLMILAMGTQFYNMQSFPTEPPDATEEVAIEILGNSLYQETASLLGKVVQVGTFESVQACMMLAVYYFPIDMPGLAFTHLGLALHLAIKNGMHRKDYGLALGQVEREVHVRVWWSLWSFYQRARCYHGHPKALSHADVDVQRPRMLQPLDAINNTSKFHNQLVLIDITLLLESSANEIIQLRRSQSATHLVNLLALRHRLVALRESLPKLPDIEQQGIQVDLLRLDIHVHLHYWHSRVFLGRPFILGNDAISDRPDNSDRQPRKMSASDNAVSGLALLSQDSISAAIHIIRLCQLIHSKIGLARASYATEFTCCRAAMLVLIASSLNPNRPDLSSELNLGLELIKLMSSGHGQASSEASVIVVLQRAIRRLRKSERDERSKVAAPTMAEATERDQYEQWASLWNQSGTSPTDTTTSTAPIEMAATSPNFEYMSGQNISGQDVDLSMNFDFSVDAEMSIWDDPFGFPLELTEFSTFPDLEF